MRDMANRIIGMELRVTEMESKAMEQAHRVGGLDAEMDGVVEARRCWFTDRTPETLSGRASAVEVLVDAIGKRIESIKWAGRGR